MNSYNENLHSAVVASLQSLDMNQKNIKSKRDASMFTLYYAQGARITAGEKLSLANVKYNFQQEVKKEAVNNNNIAINLLTSAYEQKKYTAQLVSNIAVCASNVQIASNAIVRLSSDMGSIYSILSAADYGSEIYEQSKDAYRLMNETAYNAERASQSAMDASTAAAEISSSTVADEAKSAHQSIDALLKVTSADFNTIAETVTNDDATLASASAAEKKSEGVLEIINVEYVAAQTAYSLNNRELNLNLCVAPENNKEHESYIVSFDFYKSPFKPVNSGPRPKPVQAKSAQAPMAAYPVQRYCIMLVKDSKQSVFSISNAESLLLYDDQYVEVDHRIGEKEAKTQVFISQMLDSDGDPMEVGKKYVVFVLAVLTEDYKKLVNNFDDYLSAPSATFSLSNMLSSPAPDKIVVTKQTLEFTADAPGGVEYRCMFLPDSRNLVKGLLSERSLRTIEKDVEKLEIINQLFDPLIVELESQLTTLNATIEGLQGQHTGLAEPADAATKEEKSAYAAENKRINTAIKNANTEVKALTAKLAIQQTAKANAMKSIKPAKDAKPGFFFNRKLAEQVSPASYIVATANTSATVSTYNMHALIDDATTDNFGNPLIPGKKYIPVILSVSTAAAENLDQYTNSLSDYEHTPEFKYAP